MNNNRIFVFDMDGVLVASEKTWLETEPRFLHDIFGDRIADSIGDTVGVSIGEIYEKARTLGSTLDKDEYDQKYFDVSLRVYSKCSISADTDLLVTYLLENNWGIALLSSSPMSWIDQVVKRLPWKDKLTTIVSLNEHHELRTKPAPDGYNYLVRTLHTTPEVSIALEDSNPGIASAKSAGLYTIGYLEHLPAEYQQKGADNTAEDMKDVISILESTSHKKALR